MIFRKGTQAACNHSRSILLYGAAARNPKGFPAVRCNSYDDFLRNGTEGSCDSKKVVYMGVNIDRKYIGWIEFNLLNTNFDRFLVQLPENTTCRPMEIHTSSPKAMLVWSLQSTSLWNSRSTMTQDSKSEAHKASVQVFDLLKGWNKTWQQQISKSLSKPLHSVLLSVLQIHLVLLISNQLSRLTRELNEFEAQLKRNTRWWSWSWFRLLHCHCHL
jgi:hypothetical protein